MNPTHFLYLIRPPRPTFLTDMTDDERAIMFRHQVYLKTLLDQGKLLLAGPSLDGAFGVAVFTIDEAAEAEQIMKNDPAVSSGLVTPSMHPVFAGIRRD